MMVGLASWRFGTDNKKLNLVAQFLWQLADCTQQKMVPFLFSDTADYPNREEVLISHRRQMPIFVTVVRLEHGVIENLHFRGKATIVIQEGICCGFRTSQNSRDFPCQTPHQKHFELAGQHQVEMKNRRPAR